MAIRLTDETEQMLAELEKIGQDGFSISEAPYDHLPPPPTDMLPPPPPQTEPAPPAMEIPLQGPPPAPIDEVENLFESVVTFATKEADKNRLNVAKNSLAPKQASPQHLNKVTVNVKSTKLPPPKVQAKTEKTKMLGRSVLQGGLATSPDKSTTTGNQEEGFVSVSSLKKKFETGPKPLTGTVKTEIANQQAEAARRPNIVIPQRTLMNPKKPPPPSIHSLEKKPNSSFPKSLSPSQTTPQTQQTQNSPPTQQTQTSPPTKTTPQSEMQTSINLDEMLADLNQAASNVGDVDSVTQYTELASKCSVGGVNGGKIVHERTSFIINCPPEVNQWDFEIDVIGPTGPKTTRIEKTSDTSYTVHYTPTVAGEYKVDVKLGGVAIVGSPYSLNVEFADFTDKCTADGMGLVTGNTDKPAQFTIRCSSNALGSRLRVQILGPSKAEPITIQEDPVESNIINVTYHPTAPGEYKVTIIWEEAHVAGSPFLVNILGDIQNSMDKVRIIGDGLKGGNTKEALRFHVIPEIGAGPGPLSVKIAGASKPTIVAEEAEDSSITVTYTCNDPGDYEISLRWGEEDIPGCPITAKITGEARKSIGSLCTASGDGITTGVVNEPAYFDVHTTEEAGPGPLGVTIFGPYQPGLEIKPRHDRDHIPVVYYPQAPGDYKIEVTWGDDPIKGSPFTSHVTGDAIRDSSLVTSLDFTGDIKMNQLVTYTIAAKEGAGPGSLLAKMKGPVKSDLKLLRNPDNTMCVSFVAKERGDYELELKWGDDKSSEHINGSPFQINVT